MQIKIIEDRIAKYNPQNKIEETNAFKEVAQEIALCALSQGNLFKYAGFQGGTCLRIVYGLPRFSEDLDFILFAPNTDFVWSPFFKEMELQFAAFGLHLTAKDRKDSGGAVKTAFIKEDSFGTVLKLSYPRNASDIQSIKIKLEVDTNPPAGSTFESKLIDFPMPCSVVTQDLASLFAGKLHALLCREYVKGRDWYDFIWYVVNKTKINFEFLSNALYQTGLYKEKAININKQWLCAALTEKISTMDWQTAVADVQAFVPAYEAPSLQLWGQDFFLRYVQQLETYL